MVGLSTVVFGLMKANEMGWLEWSAEIVACLGENEPNAEKSHWRMNVDAELSVEAEV